MSIPSGSSVASVITMILVPLPHLVFSLGPFEKLHRVYSSLVGANGVTSIEERQQVYWLAEDNENVTGIILSTLSVVCFCATPFESVLPETNRGSLCQFHESVILASNFRTGTSRKNKRPLRPLVTEKSVWQSSIVRQF